jgi:LysM repeat protein
MLQVVVAALPVAADEGFATWYGQPYHGRRMANGQVFDMNDPTTTANNEYPFGTWLRVTNVANDKSVDVQVRDRGSFGHGLDLSRAAFAQIAEPGLSRVRVRYEVIPGPGQEPAPRPTPQPTPRPTLEPPAVTSPDAAARPADAPPPAAPQAHPGSYAVATGDTMASIARRFGLTVADLAAWNEIENPHLLKPGQTLRLTAPPPPHAPEPAPPPRVARTVAAAPGEVYVVQPGDVLWQIAERLGVDPHALAVANQLGGDAVLMPDQQLAIPGSQVFHVVETGESLVLIAEQYGTTTSAMLELNQLPDPNTIQPGDRLRVR